jgi:hypothetical protein
MVISVVYIATFITIKSKIEIFYVKKYCSSHFIHIVNINSRIDQGFATGYIIANEHKQVWPRPFLWCILRRNQSIFSVCGDFAGKQNIVTIVVCMVKIYSCFNQSVNHSWVFTVKQYISSKRIQCINIGACINASLNVFLVLQENKFIALLFIIFLLF